MHARHTNTIIPSTTHTQAEPATSGSNYEHGGKASNSFCCLWSLRGSVCVCLFGGTRENGSIIEAGGAAVVKLMMMLQSKISAAPDEYRLD